MEKEFIKEKTDKIRQNLERILDGNPVNNFIYRSFFENLYARHPKMIRWLMKERPSFRTNRAVNGNVRIDIGKMEDIRAYADVRKDRNYVAPDSGKYPIDKENNIYLYTLPNADAKKNKLVLVICWLDISDEEVEELLKPAIEANEGNGRQNDEDTRMINEIFCGRDVGSKLYQCFFRELYRRRPEEFASLIGKRFTDDPVTGRNNRIDLGSKDALNAQWDRQRNEGATDHDRSPIDDKKEFWLVTNGAESKLKEKILWVCRTLDISPEEARFYLFGEEPQQSGAGSVENSAGDAADDLHGESPVEDTASPIESREETSDVSDASEPEKNEPAVENDANSLEVEIDSALDELEKQLNESLRRGGTGLVEIAAKIEELNKLKGELAGLKDRISKALSK